ncbi:hypothetical protein KI387_027055, partial [Taxus chinensis]
MVRPHQSPLHLLTACLPLSAPAVVEDAPVRHLSAAAGSPITEAQNRGPAALA